MIELIRHSATERDSDEDCCDYLATGAVLQESQLLRRVLERAGNAQQPDELRIESAGPKQQSRERGERDGERHRIQHETPSTYVTPRDHDTAPVVVGPVVSEPHTAAGAVVRVATFDLFQLRREHIRHPNKIG